LGDDLHAKLAAVGLVRPRGSDTLESWLTRVIDAKRHELKRSSLVKLEQTKRALLASLPGGMNLRDVSRDDASKWREGMVAAGKLSIATIKLHIGNAKTYFNEAVTRGLIQTNPFGHLAGGNTASTNERYVTPEETDKILEALPGAELKLIFGLARLAGLRTTSETHLLTWADVNFDRGRLLVRSPKTERHKGHESRIVPIFPKLMALIQARYDEAPEGVDQLVFARGGALVRRIGAAAKAAGVAEWGDLFQTLRRSCEREWAMEFPQYVVSKWIGHSITVSGKHYANAVSDDIYDRAAGVKVARLPPSEDKPDPFGGPGDNPPASRCAQDSARQRQHTEAGSGTRRQNPDSCATNRGLPLHAATVGNSIPLASTPKSILRRICFDPVPDALSFLAASHNPSWLRQLCPELWHLAHSVPRQRPRGGRIAR
jgi:integrase